ncbi:MAG: aminotransferase class III-fold pyridoxal phosphate-dependent enzyme [Pseudomonadota bacterium]
MTLDLNDVIAKDKANVWHHLTPHKPFAGDKNPMVMVEGKGMQVWDATGKEFTDAVSGGVWTVNVGYGRERIANAVRDQLVKMNYFAGAMGSVPGALFAEKLIDKMPGMSRVYYANSGSEANEKGFKIARQIAHMRSGGKKHKIIYRDRDYHGTTISTLSACGQEERKMQYGPFTPGFVEMPHCLEYRSQWGDVSDYGERAANELERIILEEGPDTVGSVCLEPITAGGGAIVPPEGYWPRIQEICKKYDVLLHIDEVVCGVGRTGTWFGYQHYGIQPDIVTMAKGVASGYAAIACTVTTEEVFQAFNNDDDRMGYFRDISTFGGCTAGPAAALENMAIIEEEGLLENTVTQGNYLMESLRELQNKHPIIGEVRGKGLFAGIELVKDRSSKEPVHESIPVAVAAHTLQNGVMIGRTNRSFEKYNNCLCLSPALIATRDDIDNIVSAIDNALEAHGAL